VTKDQAIQIAKHAKGLVDYVADTLPQMNCDADDPTSFPLMRCWVSDAMVTQARDVQRAIEEISSASDGDQEIADCARRMIRAMADPVTFDLDYWMRSLEEVVDGHRVRA
jgi:hypothetical protein